MTFELYPYCRKLIPTLAFESNKGNYGRVLVIGGSKEMSSPVYFASMAILRTGVDVVYVITDEETATVVNYLNPSLVVMPYLSLEDPVSKILPWLSRMHAILIGPGLGRNERMGSIVSAVVTELMVHPEVNGREKPIVLDGDGIHVLLKDHSVWRKYQSSIFITPNIIELEMLFDSYFKKKPESTDEKTLQELCRSIGDKVTIVAKGKTDMITNGTTTIACSTKGCLRRCGNQGDLLSGSLTSFAAWAGMRRLIKYPNISSMLDDDLIAGYSASSFLRSCCKAAFKINGRSMIASDILNQFPAIFEAIFQNNVEVD